VEQQLQWKVVPWLPKQHLRFLHTMTPHKQKRAHSQGAVGGLDTQLKVTAAATTTASTKSLQTTTL
jgi:hypothetical protein